MKNKIISLIKKDLKMVMVACIIISIITFLLNLSVANSSHQRILDQIYQNFEGVWGEYIVIGSGLVNGEYLIPLNLFYDWDLTMMGINILLGVLFLTIFGGALWRKKILIQWQGIPVLKMLWIKTVIFLIGVLIYILSIITGFHMYFQNLKQNVPLDYLFNGTPYFRIFSNISLSSILYLGLLFIMAFSIMTVFRLLANSFEFGLLLSYLYVGIIFGILMSSRLPLDSRYRFMQNYIDFFLFVVLIALSYLISWILLRPKEPL